MAVRRRFVFFFSSKYAWANIYVHAYAARFHSAAIENTKRIDITLSQLYTRTALKRDADATVVNVEIDGYVSSFLSFILFSLFRAEVSLFSMIVRRRKKTPWKERFDRDGTGKYDQNWWHPFKFHFPSIVRRYFITPVFCCSSFFSSP